MIETETTRQLREKLEAKGFSLTSSKADYGKDNMIAFDVTLSYMGRKVISTQYSMGIGHVRIEDSKKLIDNRMLRRHFSEDEISMFYAWQKNPHANFRDKGLQQTVAVKLANMQGADKKPHLSPDLAGVMHSLMLDGEPFFQAQSFEDFCDNCGYDSDSRKAEAIYKACDDIGRKLAAAVPRDVLDSVRELLADY